MDTATDYINLNYSIRRTHRLTDISSKSWNNLAPKDNPFLRYEFLSGLETHNCLGAHGWYPCHILLNEGKRLTAALPLYIKTNSIGEFVFDWQWADAYEQAGGRYYPKLVSAIPFTPVTGKRLLIAPDHRGEQVFEALHNAALEIVNNHDLSGLHVLFPEMNDMEVLKTRGFLIRKGCQYHWFNRGYEDFEDFLSQLSSKRRKEIRKERRLIKNSPIHIEVLEGKEITAEHWRIFHRFYASTFHRKWGEPRLTLPFFRHLSQSMPDSPILFMACHGDEYVAGAFAMRGEKTLYGRHWGCSEEFRFLHFELCYYQTIDYCIREGMEKLDAGAQGEHKIRRGFSPVATWSAHWLADAGFSNAVDHFLKQETHLINRYMTDLDQHSAYRKTEQPG